MIDYFPSTAMGTFVVCAVAHRLINATLRLGFAVGVFIVGEERI
jgi:hypothetical protein